MERDIALTNTPIIITTRDTYMTHEGKLELTWVDKNQKSSLEPRILLHDDDQSYHAAKRVSEQDQFDNRLIFGDNMLALRALETEMPGTVKCVYIDPPFNTGQDFKYYGDGLEHSRWLNLMRQRLQSIHVLLRNDGILWVHLDNGEVHYLKVVLDEIFGRDNFVSHITYERSGSAGLGQGGTFVNTAEHILVYQKTKEAVFNDVLSFTRLEAKTMKRYNKVLVQNGTRELVREFPSKSNGLPVKVYKHVGFEIRTISLADFERNEEKIRAEFVVEFPKLFRTNNVQKENVFQNDLMSGMDKSSLYTVDYTPSRGKYENKETTLYYYNGELFAWLKDTAFIEKGEIVKTNKMTDIWVHAEIPKADLANEGGVDFPRGKKPEQLISRILRLSTNPGDLVLDSFAGSGTTGAVAHKLRRRWIMVEMGDHCHSHVIPRLKSIIDGTDRTGVTDSAGWTGGGGFRYYRLAKSLMRRDRHNQWVIDTDAYNAERLAEAVCKIENFTYDPSPDIYWQHGKSSERDFIYVTTQSLTQAHFQSLSEEVGKDRSLLILCASHNGNPDQFANLTVRILRRDIVGRYEWGRDSYALNIGNLPEASDDASSAIVEVSEPESAVRTAAIPADDAEPMRRGPGRPRKSDAATVAVSGSQTADGVPAEIIKRKPGRPKKSDPNQQTILGLKS